MEDLALLYILDICKNKKYWNSLTEPLLEDYINKVFDFYRKRGFPFFPKAKEFRDKELAKFIEFDSSKIFDGRNLNQTMHGLSYLWSFHDHAFAVRCNNKLSPYEAFHRDDVLLSAIRKRIKFGDNMSDSGLRKMLKIHTGVQGVSNFRPTAAEAIYKLFSPKTCWDMSSGYGGRLLGAKKLESMRYIGTDPCKATYHRNLEIIDHAKIQNAELYCIGSEDFIPSRNSIDLCFTSPPYFDTEKYSDEPTQSYLRYPTREEWLDHFLIKTLHNCLVGLRPRGHIVLNVANVPSYPNLVEDIVKRATTILPLKSLCPMYLKLSALGKKKGHKMEPILIFQRR